MGVIWQGTGSHVSQKPNDLGELDNMALRAKKLYGGKGFEVLADKGYYKAEDLKKCVDNGILLNRYIPTVQETENFTLTDFCMIRIKTYIYVLRVKNFSMQEKENKRVR